MKLKIGQVFRLLQHVISLEIGRITKPGFLIVTVVMTVSISTLCCASDSRTTTERAEIEAMPREMENHYWRKKLTNNDEQNGYKIDSQQVSRISGWNTWDRNDANGFYNLAQSRKEKGKITQKNDMKWDRFFLES